MSTLRVHVQDRSASGSGNSTIDLGLERVGSVRDGTNKLVVSAIGEREDTSREHGVLATRRQVVGVSEVEGNLDRLSSSNLLKVRVAEVLGAQAETDTLKINRLICYTSQVNTLRNTY